MDNEATYQLPTTEPDPRVQLAYERTFLAYERTRIAWMRTAVLGSVSRARDDVGIARPYFWLAKYAVTRLVSNGRSNVIELLRISAAWHQSLDGHAKPVCGFSAIFEYAHVDRRALSQQGM